jgi:hypothetical protein
MNIILFIRFYLFFSFFINSNLNLDETHRNLRRLLLSSLVETSKFRKIRSVFVGIVNLVPTVKSKSNYQTGYFCTFSYCQWKSLQPIRLSLDALPLPPKKWTCDLVFLWVMGVALQVLERLASLSVLVQSAVFRQDGWAESSSHRRHNFGVA